MGRRKSKRKPPPKSKNIEALDTMFTCPFCNHEKSCEVRMDKSKNAARIQCTICLEDFQATINFLSEPIGKVHLILICNLTPGIPGPFGP